MEFARIYRVVFLMVAKISFFVLGFKLNWSAFLLNSVQKYFGISKLTKNWKKGNNSRRLVWQGIQPEKSKHHCPISQSFDQDYNVLT